MVKSPVRAVPMGTAVPNISEKVRIKHTKDDVEGNRKHSGKIITANITVEEILQKTGESEVANVETVNLHACGITKIVHMEKFSNLGTLDLSCNAIRLIENLENPGLFDLKLYGNMITSISGLKLLINLECLSLQHNRITSIGDGFANQRNLKSLRLDSNQLTHIEARDFNACRSLETLDLSHNYLESLSALKFASNLTDLIACGNRLRSIDCLSNAQLRELDLSSNEISDVSGLSALNHLQILRLSNNKISSLKPMGQLKKLTELHMNSNFLSDLNYIRKQFPSLEYLDVSSNKIADWKHIEYLKHCQGIKELYITGNPCVMDDHLNAISKILPEVTIVDGQYREEQAQKDSILHKRAASASTAITVRQVQNELNTIEMNLSENEANILKTFDSIRTLMNSLPLHADSTPRTTARSSARARLEDAIMYASINSEK